MARLTLRLPDELYQRLCAAAKRKDVSLNQAILDTLDHVLPPTPAPLPAPVLENETPEEHELRRMRAWIAESHKNDDFSAFPPYLRPAKDLPDTDTLRESLPVFNPPLSRAIIEERESYGY